MPLPNRSRTTIITMWNNELTNRFLDSLAQLVQLIDTSTGAELDYPGGLFVDPNHDHYKEYAGYADLTYHLPLSP